MAMTPFTGHIQVSGDSFPSLTLHSPSVPASTILFFLILTTAHHLHIPLTCSLDIWQPPKWPSCSHSHPKSILLSKSCLFKSSRGFLSYCTILTRPPRHPPLAGIRLPQARPCSGACTLSALSPPASSHLSGLCSLSI